MKKIINSLYTFFKDMSKHNSAAFAASVSFFFFMSLFPTLMFLFSLFTYLPLTSADLSEAFSAFVPNSFMDPINMVINELYRRSHSLLPITVIATLWTANMGMLGLIRGLNGVLDIEDNRNYFILRGIATIYTIIMLAAIILSLLLVGFGKHIATTVSVHLPHLSGAIYVLMLFRSLILFIVLTALFSLIYSYLPAKKQKFFQCLPGAILSAIGWIVITLAFSVYTNYFNGFSIYGNLTAIMVFLFWFYMCFSILIVGAFFNKYYHSAFISIYDNHKAKKTSKKEGADSKSTPNSNQ